MKVKYSIILLFFLLCSALFAANSAFAVTNNNCDNLKVYVATLSDEAFGQPITNVVATWNALPTLCQDTVRSRRVFFLKPILLLGSQLYGNEKRAGLEMAFAFPNTETSNSRGDIKLDGESVTLCLDMRAGIFLPERFFPYLLDSHQTRLHGVSWQRLLHLDFRPGPPPQQVGASR